MSAGLGGFASGMSSGMQTGMMFARRKKAGDSEDQQPSSAIDELATVKPAEVSGGSGAIEGVTDEANAQTWQLIRDMQASTVEAPEPQQQGGGSGFNPQMMQQLAGGGSPGGAGGLGGGMGAPGGGAAGGGAAGGGAGVSSGALAAGGAIAAGLVGANYLHNKGISSWSDTLKGKAPGNMLDYYGGAKDGKTHGMLGKIVDQDGAVGQSLKSVTDLATLDFSNAWKNGKQSVKRLFKLDIF